MKTNKLFILLVTAMAMVLTSCDDFLTEPYRNGSEYSTYYNTQYKLQEVLNATYNVLQSDKYNDSEWIFGDACGDDVISAGEGGTSPRADLVNFKFNTNNVYIKDRWDINYQGIHYANQVIHNAYKVQLTLNNYASYQSLRSIVGQAKFLRALFYFNLVKTYGGVPIRPEEEKVDSMVVPRSTREEVYAYIEKDLREAVVMLNPITRYDNANLGKASMGAALALLMKINMYQAEPGDGSDYWTEMVNLGEYFVDGKSITLGEMLKYDGTEDWEAVRTRLFFQPQKYIASTEPYELPTNALEQISNAYALELKSRGNMDIPYHEQWWKSGEFCKGSIFEVCFAESADGTTGDTNEGSNVFDKLIGGEMVVSSNFIAFISKDPRRGEINSSHGEYTPDGKASPAAPGATSAMKWYTAEAEKPQYSGDNGKNRRYIRYAEVVLMYAEALNECGFGARALIELNKTKTIADKITGTPDPYQACGYTAMRDNIWEERRAELAFEWDRFFDLVRQKRAPEVLHNFSRTWVYARGLYFKEGINEIFPIPQTEIDITNGVVTQNPGY